MSTHALHLTKQSVKAEVNILSCLSLRNLSLFAVSTRQLSPPIGHFFSHFLSHVMNLQRQKFLQLCALLAVFSRVDHFHPNLYWLLYYTVYFFVFENGRACKNCLPYFYFSSLHHFEFVVSVTGLRLVPVSYPTGYVPFY